MRPPQSRAIRGLLATVSLTPASLLHAGASQGCRNILALFSSLINQPEGHELQSLGRSWEPQRSSLSSLQGRFSPLLG